MWLSKSLLGIFKVAYEAVHELRTELAVVKAERDILQRELETMRVNFDWLRSKVNGLELERAQLIQRAYNISLPVPTLQAPQPPAPTEDFNFEDIGDKLARRLGLPAFDHVPEQTER